MTDEDAIELQTCISLLAEKVSRHAGYEAAVAVFLVASYHAAPNDRYWSEAIALVLRAIGELNETTETGKTDNETS